MWVAVPSILECRSQMDKKFPNREHGAEGIKGDTAHQLSASSHNPDLTGNPEYRDGDALDEVRAIDLDKDLNDPNVTMEDVVQLWVRLCRAGDLWWVRYIIYNRRIWHRRDGFITREYTGSDPHTSHTHVTTDFTQAADTVSGTNWRLDTLGPAPIVPTPPPAAPILQHRILKLANPIMTGDDVRHVQVFLRYNFPAYKDYVKYLPGTLLVVDSKYGRQSDSWVREFQRRTGLYQDGIVGPKTLSKLRQYGYKY